MDILFLSHRIPYPPNKGDKIRSYALLKHLAEHHRVHLACFVDEASDLSHRETVRSLARGECLFVPLSALSKWTRACRALITGETITASCFGATVLNRWLRALLSKYSIDRTVVFSSGVATYVLNSDLIDPSRAILDMVDVDSDKWSQYAVASGGLKKWVYRREAKKLGELELAAVSKFGATILSSPYEAQTFAALAQEHRGRIFAVSNGVDLERFSAGPFANPFASTEYPIVMTGRMDYRPNADGAKWFAKEVLPHIGQKLPNVRFYVVGAHPPASLRACAGIDTIVTGQVSDIRPYIQHASVVVAPLKMARGIQNKVLEALAMGRPVVATQAATRALAVTSGVELWIEDQPARFAAAVMNALKGADRLRVAKNGHRYVETHHNWARNLSVVDEILAALGDRAIPAGMRMSGAGETVQSDRKSALPPPPTSLAGAL